MGIGGQRERLELQAPVRTDDGAGGAAIVFSTVTFIFGVITPSRSDDNVFADRIRQRDRSTIRIRYRNNISVKNRLVQNTTVAGGRLVRTFTIVGVKNVNYRFRYLDLDVEEGVAS